MKSIISKILPFIIAFSLLSFSVGSSLEIHSCKNHSKFSKEQCNTNSSCCKKKTKSCDTSTGSKPACCQSVSISITSSKENKIEIRQNILSFEKIKIVSPLPLPIFISTSRKEIIFFHYLPPLLVRDIPILSQQFRC